MLPFTFPPLVVLNLLISFPCLSKSFQWAVCSKALAPSVTKWHCLLLLRKCWGLPGIANIYLGMGDMMKIHIKSCGTANTVFPFWLLLLAEAYQVSKRQAEEPGNACCVPCLLEGLCSKSALQTAPVSRGLTAEGNTVSSSSENWEMKKKN